MLFLSTGPGALTALGALQEAYATGVPLLVITSQVPRVAASGCAAGMLHQLDDQQRSAVNVTKSTAVVREAAEIPSLLADAWALAQSAPAGPTWVEIPQDVLLEPHARAAGDVGGHARSPSGRRAPSSSTRPRRCSTRAERPVILAGGGVRRSAGRTARRSCALAEALDAPVVSTVGGKGAIRFDHPLSAASWIEDRHTTELLEDADVLLAVGTAMGEVTSNYFTFAPRGRLIQVDAEPRVLEANHPGPRHPRRRGARAARRSPSGLAAATATHGARRTRGRAAKVACERRLADQDLAHRADARCATCGPPSRRPRTRSGT